MLLERKDHMYCALRVMVQGTLCPLVQGWVLLGKDEWDMEGKASQRGYRCKDIAECRHGGKWCERDRLSIWLKGC